MFCRTVIIAGCFPIVIFYGASSFCPSCFLDLFRHHRAELLTMLHNDDEVDTVKSCKRKRLEEPECLVQGSSGCTTRKGTCHCRN